MMNDSEKFEDVLTQLKACLKRPNAGLIKVTLTNGKTVVGQYQEGEFSIGAGGGFVTLSGGQSIHYSEVAKIE